MAVGDLVAEWFETDLLQAAIAARGIFGTAQGPWSAGTGAVLLLNAAIDPVPGGSSVTIKGGPGALTGAMAQAARDAGAEIRTGAAVARVSIRDGRATGVILEDGTEILGSAVVSNADPRRTFLDLVDPIELDPGFLTKIRHYRCPGTAAKVNLALRGAAGLSRRREPGRSSRQDPHRAGHRLPRARVRRVEVRRASHRNRISTSPSRRCRTRRWRRQAGT